MPQIWECVKFTIMPNFNLAFDSRGRFAIDKQVHPSHSEPLGSRKVNANAKALSASKIDRPRTRSHSHPLLLSIVSLFFRILFLCADTHLRRSHIYYVECFCLVGGVCPIERGSGCEQNRCYTYGNIELSIVYLGGPRVH